MTAVLLVLALAQTPVEPPTDAPLAHDVRELAPGEAVLEAGCFLPTTTCIAKAQEERALRLEVAELRRLGEGVGWQWLVVAIVGGAAAGATIALLATRPWESTPAP